MKKIIFTMGVTLSLLTLNSSALADSIYPSAYTSSPIQKVEDFVVAHTIDYDTPSHIHPYSATADGEFLKRLHPILTQFSGIIPISNISREFGLRMQTTCEYGCPPM